jgi:hypothetical protein
MLRGLVQKTRRRLCQHQFFFKSHKHTSHSASPFASLAGHSPRRRRPHHTRQTPSSPQTNPPKGLSHTQAKGPNPRRRLRAIHNRRHHRRHRPRHPTPTQPQNEPPPPLLVTPLRHHPARQLRRPTARALPHRRHARRLRSHGPPQLAYRRAHENIATRTPAPPVQRQRLAALRVRAGGQAVLRESRGLLFCEHGARRGRDGAWACGWDVYAFWVQGPVVLLGAQVL